MKKAYMKPALYAERFAIAEHISSCVYQTNFGVGCPIKDAGVVFFPDPVNCSEDGVSMMEFAGLDPTAASIEDLINKVNPTCYNSLQDYHQLFSS